MNKKSLLCVFLVAVLVGGLALVSAMSFGTVNASTEDSDIPKPSIPEFTVKQVNNWYEVPTTYSKDLYTGETITHPGYRVDNETIELSIKNQPFDYSANGLTYHLCYNVRVKPHFGKDWVERYPVVDGYTSGDADYKLSKYALGPIQSGSQYTVLSFPDDYAPKDQVDFQVQAIIGHDAQVYVNDHPLAPYPIGHYENGIAFDVAGDWSSTQTITIGESQTSTPYNGSQQTEQELIMGVAITVAVIVVGLGLLLYLIKRK